MKSKEKLALQLINDLFSSRSALISFLEERLNLKLPMNMKTEKVVKHIIDKGKEQQFCQTIFKDSGFDVKVANFEDAYEIHKLWFLLSFFTVKELVQMAKELSKQQTKWKVRKKPKTSFIQSILQNATSKEIEDYVQKRIRDKEIPRIQANKSGWILGPMGLVRSAIQRKFTMVEDMTKFLLRHVGYPHPYLEIKENMGERLDLVVNKRDPLLKEKISQLLLARLTDGEIFEKFNLLLEKDLVKITSIERYWNFVATPFGIFEPAYSGEMNLAKFILKTFKKGELRPLVKGTGTIEDLIKQKCILEPPDQVLTGIFGSGPYLIKLARDIGLVGLRKVENEKILIQSILLKLGFDVPPELESIVGLASNSRSFLKEVKSGATLTEDKWNTIFSSLERILEDLILFYCSVWHEEKMKKLKEEKWEAEIKNWIRKTFNLKKQFNYLTLGDLCMLLTRMNHLIKTDRKVMELMSELFNRIHVVKGEHLRELDFIKGCRTELTKIHRRRKGKECEQAEVLERLTDLLESWISEMGLARSYPRAMRLKREVRNEFGISYYTVVDDEGRDLTLKTNKFIIPEDVWFMIARNDVFAIDPVLIKKYW